MRKVEVPKKVGVHVSRWTNPIDFFKTNINLFTINRHNTHWTFVHIDMIAIPISYYDSINGQYDAVKYYSLFKNGCTTKVEIKWGILGKTTNTPKPFKSLHSQNQIQNQAPIFLTFKQTNQAPTLPTLPTKQAPRVFLLHLVVYFSNSQTDIIYFHAVIFNSNHPIINYPFLHSF